MKKELKSGILSADKSADGRPTVFWVNVIAVLGVSVKDIIAYFTIKSIMQCVLSRCLSRLRT